MIILIPLPLFFSSTVYGVAGLSGKSAMITTPCHIQTVFFFAAWVVIGMIWTFCSAFIVVLYPLWESRVALSQIGRGILKVGVPRGPLCDGAAKLSLCFHVMYRTSFHLGVESSRSP